MISMRLGRLQRRLSYLMSFVRDLRFGMQGLMPFSSKASLSQSAPCPPIGRKPRRPGQAIQQS